MPNGKLNRKPEFANAVEKLKIKMGAQGLTQSDLSTKLGIPQSNISKILNGIKKKPNDDFIRLCQSVGIKYEEVTGDPINDPRIQKALKNVYDGTEESIVLIARLIECAGILNTVRSGRVKS